MTISQNYFQILKVHKNKGNVTLDFFSKFGLRQQLLRNKKFSMKTRLYVAPKLQMS